MSLQQCERCKEYRPCETRCHRRERRSDYDYVLYGSHDYWYCEACGPRHVDLKCGRCGRVGCAHDLWRCHLCARRVCFESAHSLRIEGRTCCVECCVERVDVRAKAVGLVRHLPPGIVGHVGWALERLDPLPYAEALAVWARTRPVCVDCGDADDTVRKRRATCACSRRAKCTEHRCDACSSVPWACKKCSNRV